MTLASDLITALRDSELDESVYDDTQLTRIINESFTALFTVIVSRFPLRFETSDTISITSGTTTGFSLPSNLQRLLQVEIADSRTPTGYSTIYRVSPTTKNYIYPSTVSDVRDLQYEIRGSKIYTYPPKVTGTLRLWYVPTEPTDPSTTLQSIPNHFDWLFCDVMEQYCIRTEQDEKSWNKRKLRIEAMIETILNKPLDGSDCMRKELPFDLCYYDGVDRRWR